MRTASLSMTWALLLSVMMVMSSGCGTRARQQLRMSQLRTRQIYLQAREMAEREKIAQAAADRLAAENAQMQQQLALTNQRLANLTNERGELHERYKALLSQLNSRGSPLSDELTRRFEDLARRYPDFDFDPATGVSKFHSDILFGSGSAVLRQEATPLLREFAAILNDGEARKLNLLVVGHTDDKQIRQDRVKVEHPTNWHLSTNRANSVVLTLSKLGLDETRLGAAGYSMFQPISSNSSEDARQRNRRVEIYVLAPDATIAGWDPMRTSRR